MKILKIVYTNLILIALWCLLPLVALSQPNTTFSKKDHTSRVLDLSGMKWKFKMMLPGEGVKKGLYKLPSEDIETLVWNNARVPGDVYTDLMESRRDRRSIFWP